MDIPAPPPPPGSRIQAPPQPPSYWRRPLGTVKARPLVARIVIITSIALLLVPFRTTYYYSYSAERNSNDVPRTLTQIVLDGWRRMSSPAQAEVNPLYVGWATVILTITVVQLATLMIALSGRLRPAIGLGVAAVAIVASLPMTAFALAAPGTWAIERPPGPAAYALPVGQALYLLAMANRGLVAGWRTTKS